MKEIDKKSPTRGNVYTIHTTQVHTDKHIKQVPNKPTTASMREERIKQEYEGTNNKVCSMHKQQCGRDIVLEKTRTRTFYF